MHLAGTPLDDANVRRELRKVVSAAGLGSGWAPRDLHHTFVSLMSEDGVPVEEIARLVGHDRSATTERVYRKPRELHQAGEKPQVSRSQDRRNGVPTALMPAL